MSATAVTNQPMSITTRSAIAARAGGSPTAGATAPIRPTLVSRVRSRWAARRRATLFAGLSPSARREFTDTPGLRRPSAPASMRSGLDTFMR